MSQAFPEGHSYFIYLFLIFFTVFFPITASYFKTTGINVKISKQYCASMFIAAIFIIAMLWRQLKYLLRLNG